MVESTGSSAPVYRFVLPIGDWSGDGHGKCREFHVQSNKPVEAAREAYFAAAEKLGFTLDADDGPCSQYEDDEISPDMHARLEGAGLPLPNDSDEVTDDYFAELVLAFCMKGDAELKLALEPHLPMLMFYGADAKGRHISVIGYGLFY